VDSGGPKEPRMPGAGSDPPGNRDNLAGHTWARPDLLRSIVSTLFVRGSSGAVSGYPSNNRLSVTRPDPI